jgi:hypothetical protein
MVREALSNMARPENKVSIGAGVGGLSTVIAWAIGAYTNTTIPAEVGIAGASFLTFVVQYLVRN